MHHPPRIALFANTDWYLFNFRLPLAQRLLASGVEVWAVCPDGPYRKRLEELGCRWVPIQLDRQGLNPIGDLRSAARLGRQLRRIQPDLLHSFTLKSILIGTLAARISGTPRIVNAVTGLGSMFSSSPSRYSIPRFLLTRFLRWTFRDPRLLTIFQHEDDFSRLSASPRHRARCRFIPGSGVDTGHFRPAPQPPKEPTVIMVSRLLREKGVETFCAAAEQVKRTLPAARFWVVGSVDPENPDSYRQEEIEAMARRFPEVQFLGHRDNMPALYGQASVAVLPSRYGEGIPRSLLEAAACGLPLIASEGGGVRKIVLEGSTGRIVPPGDSQALAQAIQGLLEEPALMQRFGHAGRALAVEQFDLQHVLEATLAVYRELGWMPPSGAQP